MSKNHVKTITFNEDLSLSPDLKKNILSAAELGNNPLLLYPGRSVYLGLDDRLAYKGLSSGLLKLKGAAYVTKSDGSLKSVSPTDEPFYHVTANSAIMIVYTVPDAKGNLLPLWEGSLYRGGLRADRAKNEYELTKDGISKGLSVNIPVAYGVFEESRGDEEIGFVVLGVRDSKDRRMIEVSNASLQGSQVRMSDFVTHHLELAGLGYSERALKEFLSRSFRSLGITLRDHHDEGFVGVQCDTMNYSLDELTGDVVLCDLDLSKRQESVDSMTVGLHRIIDAMTCIRGMHELISNTLIGLLYKDKEPETPYHQFFSSYFYDLEEPAMASMQDSGQRLMDHTRKAMYGKVGLKDDAERLAHGINERHRLQHLAMVELFPYAEAIGLKFPYELDGLKKAMSNYDLKLEEFRKDVMSRVKK